VLNIDHHDTNERFGTVDWIVDDAGGTCQLIYEALAALGWPIAPHVASLLYAGLHDDTLGFSLPNATARALAAASKLVAAGADIPMLGDRLCRSQSLSELRLLRTVYDNTQTVADGRIAYSTVSFDELAASGCTPADIDDQVSVPRALRGVRLAILFSEGEPQNVRINFRGKDGVEVAELAKRLGGGGHRHAAGSRIHGPMARVVADVLAAATDYLADR